MLVKSGFEIDVAANGEQALRKITDGIQYALVFMDCQMPRMDGYEAAQKIREFEQKSGDDTHVPIIALTANAMQGDREKCLAAGMDDYISKPLRKEIMLELIQRHIA